jgi:hypothetical protein
MWIAAFFLFPGFVPPMSPKASAAEVAAFYRDHTARVQYSMILFNWFGASLIPILTLIVMQIRRMAHRTPIFSYAMIACAAALMIVSASPALAAPNPAAPARHLPLLPIAMRTS